MDGLIPHEKEFMLLMRYEGRLARHLRLDLTHLEHMLRQRREPRPLLSLAAPEPRAPALRSAEEPESQPVPGFAERDPNAPAVPNRQPVLSPCRSGESKDPAEPESLGSLAIPSPVPRTGEGSGVSDLALHELN